MHFPYLKLNVFTVADSLLISLVYFNVSHSPSIGIGTTYDFNGTIYCYQHGRYVKLHGMEVELWDYDSFEPDDQLATTKTDANGNFHIVGSQFEIGHLDPYLWIEYNCDPSYKVSCPGWYTARIDAEPKWEHQEFNITLGGPEERVCWVDRLLPFSDTTWEEGLCPQSYYHRIIPRHTCISKPKGLSEWSWMMADGPDKEDEGNSTTKSSRSRGERMRNKNKTPKNGKKSFDEFEILPV